jgi:hypothetical protein
MFKEKDFGGEMTLPEKNSHIQTEQTPEALKTQKTVEEIQRLQDLKKTTAYELGRLFAEEVDLATALRMNEVEKEEYVRSRSKVTEYITHIEEELAHIDTLIRACIDTHFEGKTTEYTADGQRIER